ncbi:2-amino-4-hydroxy-6-hydroxymethyldihydropteridine diphosphokinase [Deinococcus piscis]|uniref:2-amino-4-hydroxy-6-hydroxymethyldihydropteridine diphosphokinase n=1 Tax=Deinococcus piscis TaxID=394230 RepID=A0ABQ3K859_9DEIO|nr:2-amino-4-hydroxy-6-hydroxymethyldihydropteridine diphosphokinase [Deinococcus piscis]GHG04170.1 2-amino-4-hydroxy-6-hydroxymethyldihydropteridine diphosphokinase [Deinococcus piscis]
MTLAYIALGANLGKPLLALRAAVAGLADLGEVCRVSRLYRTAPVGGPPGQPDYLNAVAVLNTTLSPLALLDSLQALEAQAGRTRTVRWEARTLDLDLLLYGQEVLASDRLTVPHPLAWERGFVLAPLADVAPELTHPVTGETVLAALKRTAGLDHPALEQAGWDC